MCAAAGSRQEQRRQHAQQRRFPGPVRPDQRHAFARLDAQRHITQRDRLRARPAPQQPAWLAKDTRQAISFDRGMDNGAAGIADISLFRTRCQHAGACGAPAL